MVLKLYGNNVAPCTQRVALTLTEKNVPFIFHNIDLAKGEQKDPEYMKQQPFGQIPYIDDEGFILFESRAICRYIIDKYASQGTQNLIPKDVKGHALFEQAASIEQNNFAPFASAMGVEKKWKPLYGVPSDEARYAENAGIIDAKLAAYEVILSKHKYLTGEEVTLADLFHIPDGSILNDGLKLDLLTKRPNVARWWKDLSSRETWLKVKDGVVSSA